MSGRVIRGFAPLIAAAGLVVFGVAIGASKEQDAPYANAVGRVLPFRPAVLRCKST